MQNYEDSQKIVKFCNSSSSIFRITHNFVNSHICPLIYYSRNVILSTFEHSFILKHETSAIRKILLFEILTLTHFLENEFVFICVEENCKYSSNFWYFLQCEVGINHFQIFTCKYYIFLYAIQWFLHNREIYECHW